MKTPKTIDELSHQQYDEHLLSVFRKEMPAFLASQQWTTPFVRMDFLRHAHERFLQTTNIAAEPQLRGQQWDADRPFFLNLWYWQHVGALSVHTGWHDGAKMISDTRLLLNRVLDDKACNYEGGYAVPYPHHPLFANPNKISAETREGIPMFKVRSNSYDKRLAEWLLKHQRVEETLHAELPALLARDPGARVAEYAPVFRRKVSDLLRERHEMLTTADRSALVEEVLEQWMSSTQGAHANALDDIDAELGTGDILAMPTHEALTTIRGLRTLTDGSRARLLEASGIEAVTIDRAIANRDERDLQVTAAACRDFLEHYDRAWNESPSMAMANLALYVRYATEEKIRHFIAMR